jgi:hypothetical protein
MSLFICFIVMLFITFHGYLHQIMMLAVLFSLQTYSLYTNGQILRNAFIVAPAFI